MIDMNQLSRPQTVTDSLQVIRKKMICLYVLGNAETTIYSLTAHMRSLVRLHKFRQVHTCMNLANRLYMTGNEPLKDMVEKVFVYSLSNLKHSCSRVEWSVLKSTIPEPLYTAYLKLDENSKMVG